MSDTTGETGERVFLVVVDDSEEMKVALHFACRRAKTSGGRIALLHVQEPADFQHWMAVGDIMREEARTEGEEVLQIRSGPDGDWVDLPGATSPFHVNIDPEKVTELFRLRSP